MSKITITATVRDGWVASEDSAIRFVRDLARQAASAGYSPADRVTGLEFVSFEADAVPEVPEDTADLSATILATLKSLGERLDRAGL